MLAKRMRCESLLLVISLLVPGCSTLVSPQSSGVEDLINAALLEEFGYISRKEIPLVIRAELDWFTIEEVETRESFLSEAKSQNSKLFEAALDFWDKNQAERSVAELGRIVPEHVIVGEGWENLDFSAWYPQFEEVRDMYPLSPVITISYPGFSNDQTIAVIYLGSTRGGFSGGGETMVFEKVNGVWIKSRLHAGMSWRS